jgi:hypothetical protein
VLTGHFHEYLLRGGFPQLARISDLVDAQRLLREDIVDKVLKRDMTALRAWGWQGRQDSQAEGVPSEARSPATGRRWLEMKEPGD